MSSHVDVYQNIDFVVLSYVCKNQNNDNVVSFIIYEAMVISSGGIKSPCTSLYKAPKRFPESSYELTISSTSDTTK